MKILDVIKEEKEKSFDFSQMMKDFLPLAMQILNIDILPKIKLEINVKDAEQPTFGRYANMDNVIYLAIENRHPVDIARTLAHELVHFKQGLMNQLDQNSGDTGSPEENEAHAVAGVIMRNFNKQFPQYLRSQPLDFSDK